MIFQTTQKDKMSNNKQQKMIWRLNLKKENKIRFKTRFLINKIQINNKYHKIIKIIFC